LDKKKNQEGKISEKGVGHTKRAQQPRDRGLLDSARQDRLEIRSRNIGKVPLWIQQRGMQGRKKDVFGKSRGKDKSPGEKLNKKGKMWVESFKYYQQTKGSWETPETKTYL